MSIAALIVIALRLIVPISIFRWRISGAVVAMILDGLDVVLVDVIANALAANVVLDSDCAKMF